MIPGQIHDNLTDRHQIHDDDFDDCNHDRDYDRDDDCNHDRDDDRDDHFDGCDDNRDHEKLGLYKFGVPR